MNPFRWAVEEAREKLDVRETWRELRALGQKHGRRFFVAAVLWELVEDVVFPFISWRLGHPELIPVFLVLHFEPIVYPVFFFAFRTYDRIRGREPWEPDRLGQSTYWRAGLQVLSYRVPALVLFFLLLNGLGLSLWILTAYTLAMSLFAFVHDRLWHDSNFGIDVPTDTVKPERVVAKAFTYRVVSALVMCGVCLGFLGSVPGIVWGYQGSMLIFHIILGGWWAQSPVGIRPVVQNPSDPA